ncbi:hypothetical protein ERO13_D11G134350v2 [Gossypium hirsutum]|nr:hypothetical protein ERO13_D11G134350v2 [Gossypium hirsutum]
MTEKKSWPELVGTNGESAKETIERENRNVKAVENRVQVWIDGNGLVVRAPTIG